MTKYYDIYTQIPGIKPCPQKWVTAEDRLYVIDQLLKKSNFIDIMELSNTKTLTCRQEYFVCMVESQYRSEDYESRMD
ncbi:hypothetical protein LFP01_00046 [Lacfervirus LFP01]|uniref:Uncharacterized protein n=1 Tax=Lactobacillus phage LFP01 TaxID=3051505 RepID=A0AAX3XJ57_9CAUD